MEKKICSQTLTYMTHTHTHLPLPLALFQGVCVCGINTALSAPQTHNRAIPERTMCVEELFSPQHSGTVSFRCTITWKSTNIGYARMYVQVLLVIRHTHTHRNHSQGPHSGLCNMCHIVCCITNESEFDFLIKNK